MAQTGMKFRVCKLTRRRKSMANLPIGTVGPIDPVPPIEPLEPVVFDIVLTNGEIKKPSDYG